MTKVARGYRLCVAREAGNQEPRYAAIRWATAPRLNGRVLESVSEGYWRLPVKAGKYELELA